MLAAADVRVALPSVADTCRIGMVLARQYTATKNRFGQCLAAAAHDAAVKKKKRFGLGFGLGDGLGSSEGANLTFNFLEG